MSEGNTQSKKLEPNIESSSSAPNYVAYQLTERKKSEKPFWNRIGVGFMHQDGGGLNLVLNSLPVDGKVTLRACSPTEGDS